MKKHLILLSLSFLLLFGCSKKSEKFEGGKVENNKNKEVFAVFKTSMGDITCRLFEKQTPITVENFIALAEGTKEFTDPRDNTKKKARYYDGTIFHRVIPNFMIQGGDPRGSGTGGPGYNFEDEFLPDLKFDKPGLLAMANRGPGTNGSQFFITVAPTPHLNNKHTIFGEVIEGYDIAEKIANAKTRPGDKPVENIVIEKLEIVRGK